MACASLTIPASPASSSSRTSKDIFKEHNHIRKSYSDVHVYCCISPIHATSSTQPNSSRSIGIFPLQNSSSIVPNMLRSVLFGPYKGKPLNMAEKIMNMVENSHECGGEEIKRDNWMERLVELSDNWRTIWQKKEVADEEDYVCDEGENVDCECSGGEVGSAEGYGSEEDDGKTRYKSYDRESFSRFLVGAQWSDIKLFSQLAFLCNMAYVIPEIKARDLKIYYNLQYVTSSLEKKAEEAASLATSTMTVVVAAAGESENQETAPCEWFVCDDNSTYTRCFVIQGLDYSLGSWQAYLFFEPTKFEGTNILVHRGIYEAAKGMYEQFMPEIMDHLERNGEQAKLRFAGHCVGGSIALLVHLMMLTRNLVKPSTLRPVVTFGSPFVFCGGRKILDQLSLEENDHIHCVIMHRDIVPRAFSSNYPTHVVELLKHLNGSFMSHPCLAKNKMLYSPMGKVFILQPDETLSPPHPLLPPGGALYALDKTQHGFSSSLLRAFLNSPHPLETISDPAAYGSEGTISQDHDSSYYLKAINRVLRQRTRMVVRKVRKQRNLLWPLLFTSPSPLSLNHEDESHDK